MKPATHSSVRVQGGAASGQTLKSVLLAMLALVGAAGAFWVWQAMSAADTTLDLPEDWFEDEPDPEETIDEEASGRVAPEEEKGEEELPESLRTIYSEEVVDLEDEGRRLVVQVWNGKKGVPAAETDVFFLQGYKGANLKDPFGQHWSDFAEIRGQRFQTDLRGRVELPSVQRWAIVTAQHATAYGFAMFRPKHGDIETITMHPDETVTVRVVDDEGNAVADVPVGVVQRIPERVKPKGMKELQKQMKQLEKNVADIKRYIQANPAQREPAARKMRAVRDKQGQVKRAMAQQKKQSKKGSKKQPKKKGRAPKAQPVQPQVKTRKTIRARRRTDAQGIAVFRHFQVYRREPAKWWPLQHTHQFEAVLMMPLQQAQSRPFQGRPAPTATIELRLPPTGSIALRPIGHDGRPFRHPVRAFLRTENSENTPWTRLQGRKKQNVELIEFPFVGLNLRFTARCRLDDDDFTWNAPAFAGPNKADERVIIDVVVAPRDGMLSGRLLDSAGKRLAGVRLKFLINSSTGRLEGEDITLDREGFFHLPFKVRKRHQTPFRLEIRRNDVHPTAGLVKNLPILVAGRVTHLGDLRIDAFPLIAHGTVLDDSGKPIQKANIQLQRERQAGGKKPKLVFANEAFVSTRTDSAGHYELFARLEPGKYRLRANAKNHFAFQSPGLQQGARADIKLLRKSRVVGTVLTPSWLPSKNIRVALEPALPGEKRREDRMRNYKGKKYVYFDWVRAGTYNVVIRVQEFPDPILRIDGLVIKAGQQGIHPRLQDLDLRAWLHRFVITAVNEKGKAIKPSGPLLARIQRSNGRMGFIGFPWRGNRVVLYNTRPQIDVIPMSHGYRADPTLLPAGKSKIRFLKIPPVRLKLPGLPQLVGTTPTWIAMVLISNSDLPPKLETWDKRSGRIARWYGYLSKNGGVQMRKRDTVTIPLLRNGRYRVVVHLGTKKKIKTVKIPIGTVNVRLVPGARPQRITMKVNPEQIQVGLAEVERRRAAK